MSYKRILLSGISATVFATSAFAADIATKAPYVAPVPYVPQFSWSGCYVGGNLGWGHEHRTWNATVTTPTPPPSFFSSQGTSGNGFVGGGQLGCDYQASNWVFGVEGMFDGTTIDKTTGSNAVPGATLNDTVSWFGTLTGRVGWAADRALFYVKGGAAWDRTGGTINGSGVITVPAGAGATEGHNWTNSGWLLGGGIEYAFAPQWSVKLEYDYMGFTDKTIGFPITTANTVRFTNQSLQTVLVGLNYRFGYGGPPVGARY